MLKNFLTVAWRNLVKSKVFSIINIAGLAIGLACFTLISLYVVDELSYDRFHEKADRIYRVDSDIKFGGTSQALAVTSDPMGATLKKDYPQVEQYTRVYASMGPRRIKRGDIFLTENNAVFVDSTFFDVFSFPAIAGNIHNALHEPNTVVISESMANKYFGSTNVVGQTLETNNYGNPLYKVTAVIKDMPHNSHFHFDLMFSMDNVDYQWGNYLSHNFQTYVVLQKGTDPREFEKNFYTIIDKYIIPQGQAYMQVGSREEFEKAGNRITYTLMPIKDIHLHSSLAAELDENSNIQYVYIFSAVAIFILLIACVNFMNLSTARSSNRAKEVGIRKVLGSERRTIIRQFLAESVFTAFIALALSLLIAWLCLSYFNSISGKDLSLSQLYSGSFLPYLLLLPLIVGVLAGSYPAFYLSSFQPISVLKGKLNTGVRRSRLRSALVVFQFATSIFLIIGTLVVYRQLDYIQTKKLGFNREQVVVLNNTGALQQNGDAFKNEVLKIPGVSGGTFSGYLPVSASSRSDYSFSTEAVMNPTNAFNMQMWVIDEDYIPTLGMEVIKGRNFSKDHPTDSAGLLINEATARLLGYDDPVGKPLYLFSDSEPDPMHIVGVVKDFNYESLRKNVTPLCFSFGRSRWSASFRINTADIKTVLAQMETKWKAVVPSIPFSYRFLDDAFDDMYRTEQRVGKVALSFAVLAILIACLGLFGLATYMAEQRTKEIGVRKVLGASVTNIVSMLSKDFLRLVIISTIVAFPVAWWFMNRWLQDFAFRINIGWMVFVIAGLTAILIAVVTVSFQAIKAAIANPVKSLRTE